MTTRRLFLGIFVLALFALTAKSATDPDFGWHLRTGEYIVTTSSIPRTDFFSYTAAGEPWITHEWLTQTIIYLLYQTGGIIALVFFFALVATATFWLLYLRCEGKPYLAAFVVLFAALAAAPLWGIRPQSFALLLTSVFLYILDRYRRSNSWPVLLWLPPLMLVWVNGHASFPLGPFLILMYLIGELAEQWLAWNGANQTTARPLPLAGVFLACLILVPINPNGVELYLYPFQTLTSRVMQANIQEWRSPDFHELALQPFLWMLISTWGALALARKRIGLTELFLLVGFTFAALGSMRQIPIWTLIAAPVLAAALSDVLARLPGKSKLDTNEHPSRALQILNSIILVVIALAALLRVTDTALKQDAAEREYYPVAAVAWLREQNHRGPLFNLYDWGGYLIWKLYPTERVFIDGRADLYSLNGDHVIREYVAAINGSLNWRASLDQYNVRLVLIPPDTPLTTLLTGDPQWHQVYADETAVIFQRK